MAGLGIKKTWAGHIARIEENRAHSKYELVNLQERPLGRPRHRWEDNIRIDVKEIGANTRNWINSEIIGESL